MNEVLPVSGVRIGTACAGIKRRDRDDVVVLELAEGTTCAAVFTRNAFAAAPVQVAREHLGTTPARYLLVNSGNANAGTGRAGLEACRHSCGALAGHAGCAPEAVLPFSTGVIGEPLPVGRLEAALPAALARLEPAGWAAGARAIMTTDTEPKLASRTVETGAGVVTITGMAKGAGMIRPDMATLLAFVATDARVPGEALQGALDAAVAGSFNRVTVDGDTSTNDACVLAATAASGIALDPAGEPARWRRWCDALAQVTGALARAVARDGEGATRLVEVRVTGGADEGECERVAFTVAESPLVKTALFAGDPNWGRILAAVGRAGVRGLDIERVAIDLGGVATVRGGARAEGWVESDAAAALAGEEVDVHIDLGRGTARARVWTCDLSYDYVRINAEYRT